MRRIQFLSNIYAIKRATAKKSSNRFLPLTLLTDTFLYSNIEFHECNRIFYRRTLMIRFNISCEKFLSNIYKIKRVRQWVRKIQIEPQVYDRIFYLNKHTHTYIYIDLTLFELRAKKIRRAGSKWAKRPIRVMRMLFCRYIYIYTRTHDRAGNYGNRLPSSPPSCIPVYGIVGISRVVSGTWIVLSHDHFREFALFRAFSFFTRLSPAKNHRIIVRDHRGKIFGPIFEWTNKFRTSETFFL